MPDFDQLRTVATHADIDADAAVRAAEAVAADRGEAVQLVADALTEQILAGVGLDAAVSALRAAQEPSAS